MVNESEKVNCSFHLNFREWAKGLTFTRAT